MNCLFVLVQRMDAVPAEPGKEHLSPLPLLHHSLHPLVHPPGRSLNLSLKVLTSEMDPAKLGSFDIFIKGRGAPVFTEKSAHPPSCKSPLKIPRHLIK
jgi:hypothetical protein